MTRTKTSRTTVEVRHVAKPAYPNRVNGPTPGDLRTFVAECHDLPGDLHVRIDPGQLDESGRRDVTFSVAQITTHSEEPKTA